MPEAQQIERAAAIVFLCDSRRLMPLNLRYDADRNLDPLGQRAEGTSKAMQRDVGQPCGGKRLVMRDARFGNFAVLRRLAGEDPFRRYPFLDRKSVV